MIEQRGARSRKDPTTPRKDAPCIKGGRDRLVPCFDFGVGPPGGRRPVDGLGQGSYKRARLVELLISNMEKQEKYDSWAQNKRFDAFSDQVVYLCW